MTGTHSVFIEVVHLRQESHALRLRRQYRLAILTLEVGGVRGDPSRGALSADGTRALPEVDGHHWETICPTDPDCRAELLDRIEATGDTGDVRLTTPGFPGPDTFERDAERYIGGLSMALGTIFATRIVLMTFFTDLMTPYRLWLGSVIAVVTIVGLLLGTYLRHIEIDEQKFTWFVIALLFIISLNIFRNTVPALFF